VCSTGHAVSVIVESDWLLKYFILLCFGNKAVVLAVAHRDVVAQ